MSNPFKFGEVIGENRFCNRKDELAELESYVSNCNKVFLYSERRFGKTSLVKLLLSKLDRSKFMSVYVDCWPTHSLYEFTNALSGAMVKDFLSVGQKAVDASKVLFGNIKATTIKFAPDGSPTFGMDPKKVSAELERTIEEVLTIPQQTAERTKKTVVVVLDEIQQIMTYESDAVERHLRSAIQNQANVAYLFLGSRKHLMKELILSESRPLYRSGSHYPLYSIGEEHWIPFIEKRFAETDKAIGKAEIEHLLAYSELQPNTTQQFCYEVWERTKPTEAVSKERIDAVVKLIIQRESMAQGAVWRDLNKSEQGLLIKLAKNEAIDESGKETAKILFEKDMIDYDEKGNAYIVDRIQKLWIKANN